MARVWVPERAFELALQVRSYEVGRDGALRPANILRYFEYLATEDSADRGFDHIWYERHGSAWFVREMRLRIGTLPGIGEQLQMATWVSSYGRVQAYREYALWSLADGRLVARAQARWGYVDRATGRPTRVPDELSTRILARGPSMPPWQLPSIDTALDPEEYPRRTESVVTFGSRGYEADSQQHINNAVYMDWLEEVTATERAGAPGKVPAPAHLRRIHLEYLRPALPETEMYVEVRMDTAPHRGFLAEYAMSAGREQAPVLRARALYVFADPRQTP